MSEPVDRDVSPSGRSPTIGPPSPAPGRPRLRHHAGLRAGTALRRLIETERLNADILTLDVTDELSIGAAVHTVTANDGRNDAVLKNAGVGPFTPGAQHRQRVARHPGHQPPRPGARPRAALPALRAQGSGTIVNIPSNAGSPRARPRPPTPRPSTSSVPSPTRYAECVGFGSSAHRIERGFFATSIMDNDAVADLADDDPYKSVMDGVEQFFRASVTATAPPHAVADLIAAAIDGILTGGTYHPPGVPGHAPIPSAARTA